MLAPKKQKFRKQFRSGARVVATRGQYLAFGEFGLKSLGYTHLSEKQIEAARRAIAHFTQRGGKIFVRVFPDKPITQKGAGVGMGAGKGEVKGYVAVVTPGRILFEIAGVPRSVAEGAIRLASYKLPVKSKFVAKE